MNRASRRTFLQGSGAAVAAAVSTSVASASANEKIIMGAIGCGGQGTFLAQSFAGHKDVELAYVCDVDQSRAANAAKQIQKVSGKAPKIVADLRAVLDEKSVDAVTVATPDHWHGPATILACKAGKHVYVEKPCAHNLREGRMMIDASRRYNRVVQVGTQSRSSPPVIEAMQLLREGAIGDVLVAKAWNSQLRANIGHARPGAPPAGFDYDMWLGPAPFVPFQANRHHYTWHWWYDFGTGDIGNDGVHDIDVARWGLGVAEHPTSIATIGAKLFFDDDQQFPDTHYVVFEYPGSGRTGSIRQLVFEQRIWAPYRQEGYENGNAFYGTKGMLLLGKQDGWKLFGPRNQLIKEQKPGGFGPPHHRNFLDCVKTGKRPNADIEIGHLSAALCHLANIAARLRRTLRFDPKAERFVADADADRLIGRTYRDGHWAIPA